MSSSKKIALGGILGALCVLCIYLAVYLPTSRLFFYGMSSLFSSIILIESGANWAWTFYCFSMLLAFLLIPDKTGVLPYALFFGFYGIVKFYIEGIRNIAAELILKGIFLAALSALLAVFAKGLIFIDINSKYPMWAITVIALLVFYIYDYAYTKFIMFYKKRIKIKLK